MQRFLIAFTFAACCALAAEPQPFQISKDKAALALIVCGPQASKEVKALAAEIARYLSRLSGAEFKVEGGGPSRPANAAGQDAPATIILGRPSDFIAPPLPNAADAFASGSFHREDYILRSTPNTLYLIGATDLAVSHAVWDLLHRLGYRQFFPGEHWEVIPEPRDLSIAVDARESPAFHARRIWYNWGLWGYNNEPYKQWCARNRMAQGFELNSGHAYDSILAAHKSEFEKHPEWAALVKGERKLKGGDTKFCISNPDLRKFVVNCAVADVKRRPNADSISMEPSDGSGWCECEACAKLGNPGTRALLLANDVAEAINALDLGPKYVGMYAYHEHCAPPSIKVHPNVIVSATTAFITGGFKFDEIVSGWQSQGATMGVYDYYSVVDWDWNLPRGAQGGRVTDLAKFIPKIHGMGARFFDAESGDCWGPCGLGFYTSSRILWDLKEAKAVADIREDFLGKCFGPAKEPMREFYRLINEDTQRRPPSDLIGRMYRQLDAAARSAGVSPAIRSRLDDLILYTRYAELYHALANGNGSKETVVRFVYRIRKTMMIHAYGLWCRLLTQKDANTPNHAWKDDTPITADDIAKILSEGIAKNQPVEPGFETVTFSRNLVPAASRLKFPDVPIGSFPSHPQDRQQYFIWLDNPGSVDLKMTVQKVWTTRAPKVSLFSPQEVSLNAIAASDAYKPDGKTYDIALTSRYAGLHRLEPVDGGDYTRIEFPKGMPVTLESGVDSNFVQSHFRGAWSLYFYVPKGTKLIGGWAVRIANWAPRISGTLRDPNGNAVLDFSKLEDGWFKVPVPEGQDGKLWKFENTQGQRLLMTVPPYLARNGAELLLPAEVIERDADKK